MVDLEKDKENKDDVVLEATETTTVAKPNRDKLLGGLRKRGAELADDIDDEALLGEAMSRHKELETGRDDMIADNALILDLIANNDEAKGLVDYLIGRDEEGNSRLASEIKTRRDRRQADDADFKTFSDNVERSLREVVLPAMDEAEATDEERDEVLNSIYSVLSGNISREMVENIIKGIRYDEDIDEAIETGKTSGKNEAIDTQKLNLRKGDGLPQPNSTAKTEERKGTPLGLGRRLDPTKIGRF